MRRVLTAARPEIVRLVSEIIATAPQAASTEQLVAQWRKTANGVAAKQAGYAYQVYARSKSISELEQLIAFIGDLGELDPNSITHTVMATEIRAWADRCGVIAPEGSFSITADNGKEPPWIEVLLQYDLGYRHRRLSFLLRGINELYARLEEPEFVEVSPLHLDDLKGQLQEPLHRLRLLRSGEFVSSTLRNDIKALSSRLQATTEDGSARTAPVGDIENVMRRLSTEFDLAAIDRMVDQAAASVHGGIIAGCASTGDARELSRLLVLGCLDLKDIGMARS